MPATTAHNHTTPDLDAAADRVREASDRLADAGRKVTSACLDGVERYVVGLTEAERRLARQSQFEVVSEVLQAHANVTEEIVKAGVGATRELIRA
jgi:hypothetical protein